MYPPDGLLTYEGTKHDVKYDPHIIATDLFISDDYLDDTPPVDLCLVTTTEELNMNTSEDEPSSGLNGRLRPRKSHVPSPQGKTKIKPDGKTSLDKPKRTNTPSKTTPNKQDDLASKSDFSPIPQLLCPYCDRKFASRQAVSKHIRRIHYSTPKQDTFLNCLFCNHTDADSNLIRHMVDSHPNQYFACLDCHTRFLSTSELAEHKINVCEKQKVTYRTKARSKIARGTKKTKKSLNISSKTNFKHSKDFQEGHGFNGIVISCELKPPQDHDGADIEDNITTNLILPPSKNLGSNAVLEKNAVIVLDDIQWNKRIPPNFSFHNTDPDQILSRLGVVHRSPRTGESTRKDWFKALDDATQKFERCFDTKFYSKVASNVQENLAKFLDGSFNFNPDPDSTIKTRKSKNNVVINTAEGFPILLASEQYSRNVFDSYLPRALAPKHKWKWDNLENDRSLMTAAEILKRDSHTNNCIITLVSSLDIWTQLSMRQKFEEKFNVQPLEKKTEKQNIISKELKEILESREIPTSSQIVKRCISKPAPRSSELEFPGSLGLVPAAPTYELRPAVLSGEWVRPRCLVCCACGEHTTDSKGLSAHMSTRHPNANVQCYEIVGEPLLNADILKHLYVPPSQVCNRTRPPRGFRECTKCNKSVTLDDLHQHMLDCAGDTPAVRRRQARQRPFGVRRRRPRMPDITIRKKMRKDIRSRQRRQKTHVGPRPRIRTEVGDAETIRKMLADLPAKRHRVSVNPLNMMQRPRRKLDMQRNKMFLKKCSSEEAKNRKQNICKRTAREKDRSTDKTNDDQNKNNTSSLEDDEDNKPLKPKQKPPPTSTSVRRCEPLKRQTVISTAKRRSVRAGKRKVETADKIIDVSSSTDIEESTLDKPSQRLDLKRASYNTREHAANRGSSSNRDGQRAGCSGTNGTADNSCAPTQNVPLKHSIARLTANSETHDKSVQFHHSFLVQQECNNTNQHVPTGERTLFENEAVVSKLDKPPLNFCQKGFLDIQSFQKNKSNKPRKGLNDCIAMLKNKLFEPVLCQATGYVSVQCGSDEPIDDEPRIVVEATNNDISVNVDFHTRNLQSQENLSMTPQYRLDTNKIITESQENIQQQEKNNFVSQCTQETAKKVEQYPENSQSHEKLNLYGYKEETTHKISQIPQNLQLPKNTDSLLHHENDVTKKVKPSLEISPTQEKANLVPLYGKESLQVKQSSENSHLQDKNNLVPSCKENINIITQNVKKSSEYAISQEKVLVPPTGPECTVTHNVKIISEQFQSQERVNLVQYRDETVPNAMLSSEHAQSQERRNMVQQCREETARNVTVNSERAQSKERENAVQQYREETSRKVKLSSERVQCQEKGNSVQQYREEISQNDKVSSEHAQSHERGNLVQQCREETGRNVMLSSGRIQSQENGNLVLQYREETGRNIKLSSNRAQSQERGNTLQQFREETGRNVTLSSERAQSQETGNLLQQCREETDRNLTLSSECAQSQERGNSMQQCREETVRNVKQSSEGVNFSDEVTLLQQHRQEPTPKLRQNSESSQFHTKLDIVVQKNKTARKLKQNIEYLQLPENLSVLSQYRPDTTQKYIQSPESVHQDRLNLVHRQQGSQIFQQNPEIFRLPENLTLIPQYRQETTQKLQSLSPETVKHQENSNFLPQYSPDSYQRYKQHEETNSNAVQEKASFVGAEFKTHSKEVIPARTRRDSGHSQTAEIVKHICKRRSTEGYNESDAAKKDVLENKIASHDPTVSGTMQSTNAKYSNSYSESTILHKNAEMLLESNVIIPQTLDVFVGNRIRDIPGNIPPAHASTIVESILSAPLDLSSKVVNATHTSNSESYDKYGTLDLSNKNTNRRSALDIPIEEDVVVDLRVKPPYLRASPATLDLCVKPGFSKTGDNTKNDIFDSFPTDLSVKCKEVEALNKSHDMIGTAVVTQDLSTSKSTLLHTPRLIASPGNDNKNLNDKLEIPDKTIQSKLAQEVKESFAESRDTADTSTKTDIAATSDDLSRKICIKNQRTSLQSTSNLEKTVTSGNNEDSEINASKSISDNSMPHDLDKSATQSQKHVYDPTLKIPQYKIRVNVSATETSISELIKEPAHLMESVANVPVTVSQCMIYSNSSCASSEVFKNTIITSPILPVTGATHSIPGRTLMSSVSRIESTTPVYTLANACIAVTKIETSSATVLTNTLLSIPGSTIASTTPVYTLTGTTVGVPMAFNNEVINGSNKSHNYLPSTLTPPSCNNALGPDVHEGAHITNKCTQNESIKKDLAVDQDPETAKKIAMLPKELVEILGTMPVDHRNQLLNVLPHYVSTTVSNSPTSTNTPQTNNSTAVPMPQIMELPKPANDNIIQTDSLHVQNAANSESHSSPQSLNPRQDIEVEDKKHSITHKIAPLLHDSLSEKIQIVNDHIQSTPEMSSDIAKIETITADLSKPKTDVVFGVDSINTQGKVIDLTEDETIPPIKNLVVDVPRSNDLSPQDFSISRGTGITSKHKGNNDKTASLRAVRIKAPSLRQKEQQKLYQDSENLTADKKNNTSVTLTPEINRAKHANEITFVTGDTVNILNIDTAQEVTKERLSIMTTDELNEKDMHADTVADTSTLKTVTASTLPTNRDIISNKEDKDAVVADAPSTNIESETVNGNEINFISVKNIIDDKGYLTIQENKSSMIHEEDSEDDIILAAIVKQKQQQCSTRTKRTIKKKKTKKSRKIQLTKSNSKDDDTLSLCRNIEETDNLPNLPALSKNSSKFENKLNEKSEISSQDIEIKCDNKPKFRNDLKLDNEPNNLIDSNINPSTNAFEQDNSAVVFVEEGKENDDDNSTKVNEKIVSSFEQSQSQQSFLQKPTMELKHCRNDVLTDRPKKKKRFSDVYSKNNIEQKKPKEQIITASLKLNMIQEETNEVEHQVSEISSSKTEDLQPSPKQSDDGTKKDILQLKSEVKKNVKVDRIKKLSNEFSSDDSIKETQENDNTIAVPLRRSRRGKSLYLESNLSAIESNTDFIIDQKAPLTKKQLIFSKLLLDEEKLTKSLILSPDKECANVTNRIDVKNSISGDILSSQASDIDGSEDLTEKSKSVKRKKTLQLKRKNKKKKSTYDYKIANDNIDASEDSIENNTEVSSQKPLSATTNTGLSLEIIQCKQTQEQLAKGPSNITAHKNSDDGSDNRPVDSINKDEKYSCPESDETSSTQIKMLEKRKISKTPSVVEFEQIPKPKKTKLNRGKETDCHVELEDRVKISSSEHGDFDSCTKVETVVTCYDVPVAARRTRSKSVVVKTSNIGFDPYDIDLDDMIQKPEPLRKSGAKCKDIKTKRKSLAKMTEFKVSEERELKTEQKNEITEEESVTVNIFDIVKGKSKPVLGKRVFETSVKEIVDDEELKTKKPFTLATGEQSEKATTEAMEIAFKDNVSDSDESSKSDVPLKKYVEGKVKKMTAMNKCPAVQEKETDVHRSETETEKQNNRECKNNLHTERGSKNNDGPDLSNEMEEQIRSEQFMESFGFFSERKPRKSNLLATKKISETFHIIANEGEDLYYSCKERSSKRALQSDTKKSTDGGNSQQSPSKKSLKRGRKKKASTKPAIQYCEVCKKEFHRPDNYLRHQMTLLHVAKLSEVELKQKTLVIPEEPNYLIAYKQHMDRLKILTEKAAKQKKNSKTKIVLPSLDKILAEVYKTIREQQLARRGLSRDEALFLDCCEILNKTLRPNVPASDSNNVQSSSVADLNFVTKSVDTSYPKNDDDVDSITAKSILESEEVRNMEKELFSGLQEVANGKNANTNEYHAMPCTMTIHPHDLPREMYSRPERDIQCQQLKILPEDLSVSVELDSNKTKKQPEYKEKMYPDVIEDIDMFEDKFDKIKRKCRSQAAAAKQVQSVSEPSPGHKGRKKADKKKGKKSSKKNYQNTVMTKGALKGFDGIKVSIPTSDINMPAIVAPHEISQKKKRKAGSKKKREKKDSETSSKYDSDHRIKDSSFSQKKLDVYEFMDNEDAELFEFRPSTLMERFKSINKDTPSSSKREASVDEPDHPSDGESASDGDDFVYMSDDYVCTDEETENSSLSCELGNVKTDVKKSTPLKRKDVVEKNALMGKIFKLNAVRTEKKSVKIKETVKPKANLDQLFDSLLEEEPNSSVLKNDSDSPILKEAEPLPMSSPNYEHSLLDDGGCGSRRTSTSPVKLNTTKLSSSAKKNDSDYNLSTARYEVPNRYKYGPSTSKQAIDIYAPSTSGTFIPSVDCDEKPTKKRDCSPTKKRDKSPKPRKSPSREISELEQVQDKSLLDNLHDIEQSAEFDEDTGVARHRARRKCTVGKQNVLAETWSSESEPDGLPPRPASAESVVAGAGRKKKGRKRDGQQAFGRRGKVTFNKKQDIESRVSSNKGNSASGSSVTSHNVAGSEKSGAGNSGSDSAREACPPPAPPGPSTSGASGSDASTSKARPRPTAYYWTSEGDEDQEHQQQQHGWIVGNSHKRLVTMLAHAKGRKRNNDEKRHLVE